jgi:hypothetical protein
MHLHMAALISDLDAAITVRDCATPPVRKLSHA